MRQLRVNVRWTDMLSGHGGEKEEGKILWSGDDEAPSLLECLPLSYSMKTMVSSIPYYMVYLWPFVTVLVGVGSSQDWSPGS